MLFVTWLFLIIIILVIVGTFKVRVSFSPIIVVSLNELVKYKYENEKNIRIYILINIYVPSGIFSYSFLFVQFFFPDSDIFTTYIRLFYCYRSFKVQQLPTNANISKGSSHHTYTNYAYTQIGVNSEHVDQQGEQIEKK